MMQQFATLIDRMKAVPEGGGTLLSNSIVLFGNHMQDGSNHDGNHLPWIAAGQCGGFFKTGMCLPDHKPSNGFMTEVCNAFEVTSPSATCCPTSARERPHRAAPKPRKSKKRE